MKLGLSEKANFEVTLFRAVESARSKSIDQVIGGLPRPFRKRSEKKSLKPEVKQAPKSAQKKFLNHLRKFPGKKLKKLKARNWFPLRAQGS